MTVRFADQPIEAKRLAVGDRFVADAQKADAVAEGWCHVLHEHVLSGRGDYTSIVGDDDGCTWTERYQPDEMVWLVKDAEEETRD